MKRTVGFWCCHIRQVLLVLNLHLKGLHRVLKLGAISELLKSDCALTHMPNMIAGAQQYVSCTVSPARSRSASLAVRSPPSCRA